MHQACCTKWLMRAAAIVMENDRTASALTRAAANFAPLASREQERTWKGYWTKFWCFGSHKRSNKQIVPSLNSHGTIGSAQGWMVSGVTQANLSFAPPSSPASIINSSIQSPTSFTLPLAAALEPGPTKLMYTIGPYAHETQLVTPPAAFSTLTTQPSTASLTPHPELANLTTPPSPEVPFAQLLASSLRAKSQDRRKRATFSPLSLDSPGDATPCGLKPVPFRALPHGELVLPVVGSRELGPCSTCDTDMAGVPMQGGNGARFTIENDNSLILPTITFTSLDEEEHLGQPAFMDSKPEGVHLVGAHGLSNKSSLTDVGNV